MARIINSAARVTRGESADGELRLALLLATLLFAIRDNRSKRVEIAL